jgi:hypothetical protein
VARKEERHHPLLNAQIINIEPRKFNNIFGAVNKHFVGSLIE